MNYSTWIEIDRANLEHNILQYHSWLPKGTMIAPVIKANAYGHGAYQIASIHEQNTFVSRLCVVHSQEAILLRKAGIKKPILVIGYINSDYKEIALHNIDVTVYETTTINDLNQAALHTNTFINVHLKIDTGMSRFGIDPKDFNYYLDLINQSKGLKLQGLWSHLSSGNNKKIVLEQEKLFQPFIIKNNLEYHIGNSLGSLKTKLHYSFVRIGIGLYGYLLTKNKSLQQALKPVLSLKTKIAHIKHLEKNRHIGYKRLFTTTKPITIAILSIGYYDGIDPLLINGGKVIIHGHYAPILSINMNLTTIDISDIPNCAVHDTVTILGTDGNSMLTAYDWQKILKKNIRECFTRFETSLPRIIINPTQNTLQKTIKHTIPLQSSTSSN